MRFAASLSVALVGLLFVHSNIYLLHFFLVAGIRVVFPGLEAAPIWQRVTAGAAYLALAIGAAWLSYRIVEVPWQRLMIANAGLAAALDADLDITLCPHDSVAA